jgi:hypothetical protein
MKKKTKKKQNKKKRKKNIQRFTVKLHKSLSSFSLLLICTQHHTCKPIQLQLRIVIKINK